MNIFFRGSVGKEQGNLFLGTGGSRVPAARVRHSRDPLGFGNPSAPRPLSGFTLTEMMVSLSLFVTLSALVVGIFIRGMRAERTLSENVAVGNDMSFALEQMIRDIRSGYDFWTDPLGLDFTNRSGQRARYELDAGAVWRESVPPPPAFGPIREKITGDNVEVPDMIFTVMHERICDPWRVTIRLAMKPRGSLREPEWIQTTVSSRILPADISIDINGDGLDDFQICEDKIYGK